MKISESSFDGIQIIQTRSMYSRTPSGYWKKKPDSSITEEIPAAWYCNATNFPWKGDRTERGYTYAGYIPTKITSTSPDSQQKCVWEWSFRLIH